MNCVYTFHRGIFIVICDIPQDSGLLYQVSMLNPKNTGYVTVLVSVKSVYAVVM